MGALRIGVDARPLCHPGTGIYRYTCELLSRMQAIGSEWFLYSPLAYDPTLFQGANVTHRCMNLPAVPGAAFLGQFRYQEWIKKDEIDVFWSPRHHLPMNVPAEVRTVLSVHDLVWKYAPDTMPLPSRLAEMALMPRSIRRADSIVALSEFTRMQLQQSFPECAGRLSTVSPASHLPPLDSLVNKPVASGRPYFLFVGTMEPRKNLARLLSAYRRYVDKVAEPKALKLVGGRGWGRVDPAHLIQRHGLVDHVEVCGKVEEHRLQQLYARAYALVLPSTFEGFGLPIIEALSQGIPVITSANSAMAEAVGPAGLLIDPASERSIFEALVSLSNDQGLYEALEKLTLAQCLRYDWQRSAEQLYGLLTTGGLAAIEETLQSPHGH